MWRLVVALIICLYYGISGQHEGQKVDEKWCHNQTANSVFGELHYTLDRSFLRSQIVVFHVRTTGNWSLQLNLTRCDMIKNKNGSIDCVFFGIDIATAKPDKVKIIRVWKHSLMTGDVFERTHPPLDNAINDQNQIYLTLGNTDGDVPTFIINGVEIEINDFFYCKDCVAKSVNLQGTKVVLTHVCYEPDQAASNYPEYHHLMPEETDSRGQQIPDKSYRYGVYGQFNKQRSIALFGRTADLNWNIKVKLLLCVARDEQKLTDCRFIGFEIYSSRNNIVPEFYYRFLQQDPITGRITSVTNGSTTLDSDEPQSDLLLQIRNLETGVRISPNLAIRSDDFPNTRNLVIQFIKLQTENYRPKSTYYERSNTDSNTIELKLDQCKSIKKSKPDASYSVVGNDNFPPGRKLIFNGTIVAMTWSLRLVLRVCSPKEGKYVDCFTIVFHIANDPLSRSIEYRALKGDKYGDNLEGIYRKMRLEFPSNALFVKISNAHNILQVSLNGHDIPWIHFTYCKNRSIIYLQMDVDKYRLDKVCYKDEPGSFGEIFDYHHMSNEQSAVINQTTPIRLYRFGTNDSFDANHSMVFGGNAIDNNWMYKLNLSVCAKEIDFVDCFFLIFSALPSETTEADLECTAWKENAVGSILRYTNQTFYNVLQKNNSLYVKVLHVNDALLVAFNEFEIRMSGVTYCKNCVIQFINAEVFNYKLANVSYHFMNESLPLPSTKVNIGRCSYKNTKENLKDVTLQVSSDDRNDNLTYYGSVARNSWYFKVLLYQVIDRPSLLFHIEPHQSPRQVNSTLEYNDVNGHTFSYGPFSIPFQSINIDGFRPIEVTIKYRGRYSGNYEFFINGRDSLHSFDGNVFNRFNVSTKDAYVDKVCVTSK